MHKLSSYPWFLMFGLIVLGVSCSGPAESEVSELEITSPPLPTDTPEPTATPTTMPTDTPTPTAMPTDTPTPTPTPTATPEPSMMVKVLDSETGEPISGTTVELSSEQMGAVFSRETDRDGLAEFTGMSAGNFDMTISAAGYYGEADEGIVLSGEMEMEFTLTEIAKVEVISDTITLRSGPGDVYDRIGEAEAGEMFEIVNQNEDGSWLMVDFEEESGDAWVDGQSVTISGGIDRIESIEPPPTPTAAPTVILPTATPETEETIVLFYRSNPNEVLGEFPVRELDPNELYSGMILIRDALYRMRDALPGARAGDGNACSAYVSAYNNILYSGVFYDPVPPEWQDIDGIYYISFIYSLDRTRPAYLSCANSGAVDDFNASLAQSAIEEVLSILEPAINAAAGRL